MVAGDIDKLNQYNAGIFRLPLRGNERQ